MPRPRFTSEQARAAAKRSAEVRKERKAAQAQEEGTSASEPKASEGSVAQGRVAASSAGSSATDDAVLASLEAAAKAGDVPAARELRAWREARFVQERSDLAQLDRVTRRRLLDRLLAELESPAQDAFEEGMQDGFDVALATSGSAAGPQAVGLPGERRVPSADDSREPSSALETPETHADGSPSADGTGHGSHTPDGTSQESARVAEPGDEATTSLSPGHITDQMTVDDCIADAEKE